MLGRDEAEKRIAEVGRSGDLYLSLANLGLDTLPESLWYLTHIEQLHLEGNALTELSAGVSQLVNLQVLNLSGNALEQLPPEIERLQQLHSLTLGVGPSFDIFPDELSYLESLSHVEINGGTIDTWVAQLSQLPSLEYLTLNKCTLLDIRGLSTCRTLSSLALVNCTLNDTLPQLESIVTLDELVIDTSDAPITHLPDEIGNLLWLKNFVIRSELLEALPESIGNLKRLRVLHVHAGDALQALPESIGQLENLLELSIHRANMETLPDTIDGLQRLTQMRVQNSGLRTIPASIGRLRNLRNMRLSHNTLRSLPAALGDLEQLRYLCVDNNTLTELPSSLAGLKDLAYVTLEDNAELELIPDGLRVSNYIEIGGTGIQRLPDSLMGARVDLYGNPVDPTPYFSEVDDTHEDEIWTYQGGALRIYSDTASDTLIDALPRLQRRVLELSFEEMDVAEPPLDISQFQKLEKLIFGVINYGQNLPITLSASAADATGLRDLEVLSSWLVLPEEIGNWEALEHIFGENARIDFPDVLTGGELSNLRVLSIGLGSTLTSLPDWLGSRPKLDIVRIHECTQLRELPESFADHHMEEVSIFQCEDFQHLPDGMTLTRLLIRKDNQIQTFPGDLVITGYLDASGLEGVPIPDNFKRLRLEETGHRDLQSIYIDPRYLTPVAVLTETSPEIQRAQVGAVGLERFLDVLNADIIDEDEFEGKLRRVLRVKLEGEDPVIAVEIRDQLGSTFRVLAPDMQPPQNASQN